MVIDDPQFTPMGIDLWDMTERMMLKDLEYVKVLVLPRNDGRFDDAEEDLELKEVSANDAPDLVRPGAHTSSRPNWATF
ncbi:hypothetical protein RIF29_14800 [Crotalaria pallida]|uniref:Uncharacterized protein n=1 Tax=Crotalaria pallida TaxID=3830 RepID=A0AAN9FCA0_CROPI